MISSYWYSHTYRLCRKLASPSPAGPYRLLCFVLDDEQLAWSRLLANRADEPADLFGNEPHIPRNEFLLKIQDYHWFYCRGCLKLHPKNRSWTRSWPHDSPTPNLCYMGLLNVVDLCACLALTVHDRTQLAMWLRTGEPGRDVHRRIRDSFQFRVLGNRPILSHHCSVTSNMDAFYGLAMMVELGANDCLVVTTRYHVRWTKRREFPPRLNEDCSVDTYRYLPSPNVEPVALCQHYHAIAWIYRPMPETSGRCSLCKTVFHLLGCSDDGLSCVIQGVRNLPWHEYLSLPLRYLGEKSMFNFWYM